MVVTEGDAHAIPPTSVRNTVLLLSGCAPVAAAPLHRTRWMVLRESPDAFGALGHLSICAGLRNLSRLLTRSLEFGARCGPLETTPRAVPLQSRG